LINRNNYFARFARPYARELYYHKPCADFVKREFLAVDETTAVSDLGVEVAKLGETALADGFILVSQGRFRGLCTGITLVRALSDIQEDQHRQLLSGIDYASTIQTALMADSRSVLERAFRGRHSIVWMPRDTVGGDCFFAVGGHEGVLIGAIDCTGHGVPGALLTSIALSEANRLSADDGMRTSPAAMLKGLNQRVKAALQQHDANSLDNTRADDGMDAVFVYVDLLDETVKVASAKLPVFLTRTDGDLEVIKGDRKGIGYRDTPADYEWTEHAFVQADLSRMIIATDGLCDQIGEVKAIAFGWNRVRQAIENASNQPIAGQVDGLWNAFVDYQGRQARRDDVTVIGLDFTPQLSEVQP
jgi:serine phosphatase RsbU (regulator of sigma subunit)